MRGLLLPTVLALLAAACGGEEADPEAPLEMPSPGTEAPGPEPTDEPAAGDDAPPVVEDATEPTTGMTEPTEGAMGDGTSAGAIADGAGTYVVREAGQVDLAYDGDRLAMENIREADGWSSRIDEDDDDEVEVVFNRHGERVDFEAEIDNGRLEVEVCALVGDGAGAYDIGDAGRVEIAFDGDQVTLVDVSTADGWTSSIEEEDDDEVEVRFRSDNLRYDFEAEEDDGLLEVEVCEELRDG